MALPSVTSINDRSLEFQNCSWPYEAAISNVSSLELSEYSVSAKTVSNYLRCIRCLGRFVYNADTISAVETYPDALWEPQGIVAALCQHASKSLVHLESTEDSLFYHEEARPKFDSGEVIIGILRDFEKVEIIRVDIRTLFKKIDDMEDVAVGSESLNQAPYPTSGAEKVQG